MQTKSNQDFCDMVTTCEKSPGQYSAVKGYRSSRGSIANYLVRPGVSRNHRLRNSIEYAQRLNGAAIAEAVNAKYQTDSITASDADRYIASQIPSWE